MKKLLRKRSLFLVALLVGLCMPMMAQETSTFRPAKEFGASDYSNSALIGDIDTKISYEAKKGSGNNNPTFGRDWALVYYNYRLQLYKNNQLVIKSKDSGAAITSVVLTLQSSDSNNGGTWSVSAKKGTSTLNNVLVNRNGTSVTVNLNSQSADEVTLTVSSQANIKVIQVVYSYEFKTPSVTLTSAAGTELTKGQVTILETTSNSNGTVSYTSNNTSVATVSSTGVVSTVGIGEVTLTANVAAAGRFTAGSASIKITVKEPEPDPNAWTVDSLLTIQGVKPVANGKTKYYLKNVGTGLNINYGGEWGTHCIESQSAHPIVLEDNGDGTYAIASFAGYLESNTLWMDSLQYSEDGVLLSKWRLEPVDGYPGQYHIIGDYDRYLSSVGNRSGLLVLKANEAKAFQRWVFTTGPDIRNSLMPHASADLPIDVTVAIRGASFDLIDDFEVVKNTPEAYDSIMPYLATYWTNYTTYDTWVWNRGVRSWNPEEYNYCNIIENLGSSVYVSYNMTLPPGAYRFTCEGFYRYSGSSDDNVYVRLYDSEEQSALGTIKLAKNTSVTYGINDEAAKIFRDNDNYLQETTFFLGDTTQVQIQVDRDGSSNSHLIYLDNFNLYYTGFPTVAPAYVAEPYWNDILWEGDWGILCIWNKETQSYDYYGRQTSGFTETELNEMFEQAMREYELYQALVEASEPAIQNALDNADDNIIYKNYLTANINAYKELLGDVGDQAFISKLKELGVDPDNLDNTITDRLKYYDAIAKMEEAFAYAMAEDAKETGKEEIEGADDHIDFSGAIFNHTFDFFTLVGNLNKPKGWTYVDANDTQVALNAHETYKTTGVDGMYLFNTWGFNASGEAYFGGTPISQTVTDLPTGTYLLSALMTSDAGNHLSIYAEDKERIFQVDHDGKIFDDYGVRFEVGTDGNAFLGVAGAKDDGTCTKDANGRWYKCDNFRLEYLPNGVLTLKEEAERITNIDDSFHGVKVERAKMSTTKWSTFVVPFSMAAPTEWEVMEITGAEARKYVNDNGDEYDDLNLKFKSATTIEAGKPYMVRLKAEATEGTIRTAVSTTTPDVSVKTREFANPVIELSGNGYDYKVEFIGSYTKCTIPNSLDADGKETGTNYYFVSNNKFYRSTGNGNVMKGFRGYFKVTQTSNGTNANARGLRSLAMTRTETDIENEEVDIEEVTVVAIYDVNGIRLSEMKPGINILRMNNGTTKKVMVK